MPSRLEPQEFLPRKVNAFQVKEIGLFPLTPRHNRFINRPATAVACRMVLFRVITQPSSHTRKGSELCFRFTYLKGVFPSRPCNARHDDFCLGKR